MERGVAAAGESSIPPVLVDSSSRRGGTHEVTLNGVRDRRAAPLRSRSWSRRRPQVGWASIGSRVSRTRNPPHDRLALLVKVHLPVIFLVRFAEAAPIFAQRFRDALACSGCLSSGYNSPSFTSTWRGNMFAGRFRGLCGEINRGGPTTKTFFGIHLRERRQN